MINYKISYWIGQHHIAGKVIFLNLVYLIGMLLFFKPILSTDDYMMSAIVYGAYENDYDYHTTFENFLYGRLVVALLRIFPSVPWYTVLFYLWIFIALCLLSYAILKWNDSCAGWLLVNMILLFFSFEGYIGIQFTKVAGIVGSIAFFFIFLKDYCWKYKLAAMWLWCLACLIRYDCAKMVIGAWSCAILLKIFIALLRKKNVEFGQYKKAGVWTALAFCIFLIIPRIGMLGTTDEEKELWKVFWEVNNMRARIQDYSVPDYDKNKEIYDMIGVTKNDLYILNSWNWDCSFMTKEKFKVIHAMQQEERAEDREQNLFNKFRIWKYLDIKSLVKYFKIFPRAFFNIDVFTTYILMIVLVSICFDIRRKDIFFSVVVSGSILLILNYYLFINGRFLQHRVDVGIIMAACVIYLHLVMEYEHIEIVNIRNQGGLISILILLVLGGRYFSYAEDRQLVSDEIIARNKIFYNESSVDTDNLYFMAQCRQTGGIYLITFYEAFDVPPIGIFNNMMRGNSVQNMLEVGGDFYMDMIDSDQTYFVLGENDSNRSAWEVYFTEHSGKNVDLTLVKNFLDKHIYRVHSEALKDILVLDNINLGKDQLICEVSIQDSEPERFIINGKAYLKGNSGFTENSYIQIIDSQSGDYELYYTQQSCDETKTYGEDGYFAKIKADIELPEFYDRKDMINLLVEQDGIFYSRKIR